MSPKFESTNVIEAATPDQKREAESLRLAFAVIGTMIAENWLEVDFQDTDWHGDLKNKVTVIAEVLHEFK